MYHHILPWHIDSLSPNAIPDSKVHGTNMGPSGADRTQVGPIFAPWTLLFGGHVQILVVNILSDSVKISTEFI